MSLNGTRLLVCNHPYTGTVAWPTEHTTGKSAGKSASAYCCSAPGCVADAADWVQERTGHQGIYRPFPEPEPVTGGPPRRVQISRAKGYRRPPNTVFVSQPSRWGNPWTVSNGWTQAQCVAAFDRYLATRTSNAGYPSDEMIRRELAGKNLACWCRLSSPCHADVLLRVANG